MEKKQIMNKKANVLDWFYILGVLFMIGVALFAAFIIIDKTIDSGVFEDVPEAKNAANITKQTILGFDNIMLFVIVGLSIFMLVSSAMVFNHPAFFIISFFLLLIAIAFAAIVSNTFWTFSNASTILSTAANFPKVKFLMERLPFYVAFMGIASAITMYVSYTRQ